jgi:hypothetical protein
MLKIFPCTPTQLAALRTQLAAKNITVPEGNSGAISAHGFLWSLVINFSYDGANLSLTIVTLPPFTSPDDVWNQIQSHLN